MKKYNYNLSASGCQTFESYDLYRFLDVKTSTNLLMKVIWHCYPAKNNEGVIMGCTKLVIELTLHIFQKSHQPIHLIPREDELKPWIELLFTSIQSGRAWEPHRLAEFVEKNMRELLLFDNSTMWSQRYNTIPKKTSGSFNENLS